MKNPEVTVVLPVSKRCDGLKEILAHIDAGLGPTGRAYEVLMVIDGDLPHRLAEAREIAGTDDRVRVLTFARMFGEGAALRAGLQASESPFIVTHPAYFQVESSILPRLLDEVAGEADVAFAARLPKKDAWFNRFQRWCFNVLIRRALWVKFRDIASGVRALKREALEDVAVHGPFHRFLPVLAAMKGRVVREVLAPQHEKARRTRVYSPRVYLKRFLDLVNVFFLARFTYKPLRFFGLLGSLLLAVGLGICLYMTGLKLFGGEAIGDRPLLLFGVLLTAVGFQTLAIGLLGELITFSQASRSKPYAIREVVRKGPGSTPGNQAEESVVAAPLDERGVESPPRSG